MTWVPCRRIVRADVPPAFRVRGINAPLLLCWPNAALASGADYGVDFSGLLDRGERIVAAEAQCSGASIAWVSLFGPVVALWTQWSASGSQQVMISVRTSFDVTLDTTVSIMVRPAPSLITPAVPAYAPNAFLLGAAIVPDASGNPLIFG
ncbi:hypothetical protein [Gluconobacter oxydans]|uniref:hypothetical protein n=1 Tax=Gluconobacter oxydans TaxID=442 RepID=UPI0007865BC5|nr:hypothetical protein [Gluconobacter oxydans]KXV65654.1 hypothetical protein AD950_04210 [Gluconobacter oxydans]